MLEQLHGTTRAKADQIATVGFDEQLFNHFRRAALQSWCSDFSCGRSLQQHIAQSSGSMRSGSPFALTSKGWCTIEHLQCVRLEPQDDRLRERNCFGVWKEATKKEKEMGIASKSNLLAQARPDTLATSLPPTTEQLQNTSLSHQTAEDARCIHISALTDLEATFRTKNETAEGKNRSSNKKLSS